MPKFERYHAAIDFLEGLNNLPLQGDYMIDSHHAEMYLKRMRYFIGLLGDPDKGMKFIHIAGTSGKGTVTTMLHEILHSSGLRVGSFTSPSVCSSIEKIRVGSLFVSPDEFADIVEYLKPFIDVAYCKGPYGRPSYFEIFLAVALIYFKRQKCDYVVLEVGLGGRFDATNVIEKPAVTAITNIDYDHTELLGKTLQKIAFDKAGIIKRGSTFFTTEQRPGLLEIFNNICVQKGVSMNRLPHQDSYQKYNVALATVIAGHLKIHEKHINQGVVRAKLPCRFEIMKHGPLVILDGAHNRSKIASTIENLDRLSFKKLYLIIGIADNKDHLAILKQIIPRADHIYFTRFQNKDRKCAHPKSLLLKAKSYIKSGTKTEVFLDPYRVLAKALKKAHEDDAVLVAGSFFLAGELRKLWLPEDQILKNRRNF